MKILYIAANPYNLEVLDLSPEITQIQRRAFDAVAAEFIALPSLKFEDLPSVLHQQKPDILHIATHANAEHLLMANYENGSVRIDAQMIASFLSQNSPPKLVYINACDSENIAKELSRYVSMAIGSTAPISVKSARTAAMAFYDRILDGDTVARAYAVCEQVMRGISDHSARMVLHFRDGIDPNEYYLYPRTRFIAEFTQQIPTRNDDGEYEIRFGLLDCPENMKQVVFFTDDSESIVDENKLERDLCTVVREPPRRGLVLMEEEDAWDIDGDFRLYAVGVSGDGSSITLSAMLCDALDERYRVSHGSHVPAAISCAIADLRRTDGSKLL